MIKKMKAGMSVTAKMPLPERDTLAVANRLLRMFKQYLPATIPMPAKSEAGGLTTIKFSPDRKLKTKQIVAAVLEGMPDWTTVEVGGANHNQITVSMPTPLGTAYTETLTVMANDQDPESKLFMVIITS